MEPSGGPAAGAHNRFGQIPPPSSRSGAPAHRRAHSETFIRLPDDFLFDNDPDFSISDLDFPSLSDDNVSGAISGPLLAEPQLSDPHSASKPVPGPHLRNLSMDSALFEGIGLHAGASAGEAGVGLGRRGHHRRSGSVDGSISPLEGDSTSLFSDHAKKAMSADKIAELALLDPKRAKRHDFFPPLLPVDCFPLCILQEFFPPMNYHP